jgi:hypothetical protein
MAFPILNAKTILCHQWSEHSILLEDIVENDFNFSNELTQDSIAFLIAAENKLTQAIEIIDRYENLAVKKTEKKADQRETIDSIFSMNLSRVRESEISVNDLESSLYNAIALTVDNMQQEFEKLAKAQQKDKLSEMIQLYSDLFDGISPRYKILENKKLRNYSNFVKDFDLLKRQSSINISTFLKKSELRRIADDLFDLEKEYKSIEKRYKPFRDKYDLYSCKEEIQKVVNLRDQIIYAINNYDSLVSSKRTIEKNIHLAKNYAEQLPSLTAIDLFLKIRDFSAEPMEIPNHPVFSEISQIYNTAHADLRKTLDKKEKELSQSITKEYESLTVKLPDEPKSLAEITLYVERACNLLPQITQFEDKYAKPMQKTLGISNLHGPDLQSRLKKYQETLTTAEQISNDTIKQSIIEVRQLNQEITNLGIDLARIGRINYFKEVLADNKSKYDRHKSDKFLTDSVNDYNAQVNKLEAAINNSVTLAIQSADSLYSQMQENPTKELKANLEKIYNALGHSEGVNKVKTLAPKQIIIVEGTPQDRFHIGVYLRQFPHKSDEYKIWADILLGNYYEGPLMERISHLQRRIRSKILSNQFAADTNDVDYISNIRHGLEEFSVRGHLADIIKDFDHRKEKVQQTLGLLDNFIEQSQAYLSN